MPRLISLALALLITNTPIVSSHWHAYGFQNSAEVIQDDAEHPGIELMLTPARRLTGECGGLAPQRCLHAQLRGRSLLMPSVGPLGEVRFTDCMS